MDCDVPGLLELVRTGAWALWALVCLIGVRELRIARKVVENGKKGTSSH